MTKWDKEDLSSQLSTILYPSKVIDVAIDSKRMVVYAAVAFYGNARGNYFLPDGDVYGVVAQIYEERDAWHNFIVTSDEMPSETDGIARLERYCKCPARILKKLSPPKNEWAQQWREVCRKNTRRKKN